jgi:hypothetical protein
MYLNNLFLKRLLIQCFYFVYLIKNIMIFGNKKVVVEGGWVGALTYLNQAKKGKHGSYTKLGGCNGDGCNKKT